MKKIYTPASLSTMGVHDDSRNLTNSEHVALYACERCYKFLYLFSSSWWLFKEGKLSYARTAEVRKNSSIMSKNIFLHIFHCTLNSVDDNFDKFTLNFSPNFVSLLQFSFGAKNTIRKYS